MKNRNFDYLILPVMLGALVVGLILSAGIISTAQRSTAPEIEVTRYLSPVPPTTEPTVVAQVPDTNTAVVEDASFDAMTVERGRSQFQTVCAACHGSNARGIPGLGKDLIQGEFALTSTDEELTNLIIEGRQAFDPANTTGVTMPARGGNPMLTDDHIREIVVYLRATQASELGSVPAQASAPAAAEPVLPAADFVLPIDALGFSFDEPEDATTNAAEPAATSEDMSEAAKAYNLSCAGCHGLNGEGTPNNGTPLVGNVLLENAPDAVVTFLSQMRPPIDPQDDFPHPVMGEYPALTMEQLRALVDYARTLGE